MKLTTWERLSLIGIIEAGSTRNIGQLRLALGILKKLRMTDEEKEKVGYSFDGEIQQWDESDWEWDITLTPPELVLVRGLAQMFQWPIKQGDQALQLIEKLGIE